MAQAQASSSTTTTDVAGAAADEKTSAGASSDDAASLQSKLSLLVPRRRRIQELQLAEERGEQARASCSYVISNVFCGRCTSFLQIASSNGGASVEEEGRGQAMESSSSLGSNGVLPERDTDEKLARKGSFLMGCGRNSQGEVGCGVAREGSIVAKFVRISALSGREVKYLTGGQFFTVALTVDGLVYTWGQAEFTGELGVLLT